ncbi:MAG: tetratricopeptide repeat protein [Candidatus Shapirobacteria bacterium]|jgi:tetratricopeptide (TPR) repeat protein
MSQKRLKKLRKTVDIFGAKEEKVFLPNFWEIIKRNWVFLVIISILAIGLYANAMNGAFVSDDYATIPQNPHIGDFWYTMKQPGGFANSMYLSNYLIFKIFGFGSPVPYHLFSLFCFLIFNILGFVLTRIVTKNDKVSMLTMLLFVFLPIHVEAVSWIAGRVYLILAIYISASLINFIYFVDNGKYKYLIWSGLFFLLAFLTDKPRPFAIFLLIILYFISTGFRGVLKKYSKYIWVLLAIILVAFAISWPFIKNRITVVNGGYNVSDSIFYDPLFQYPTSIPNYLQLMWFPANLTLYHTLYVLPNWLNWLILINYLALVVYFYFRDKRYFWALSFIFVSIAPSISPIKVSWLVAERYIFLGSLGFCTFLGLLMFYNWSKAKIVMPVLLVSILAYFGVRVYLRNIDWSTNHNLWVNTCQVSPNSHNAWNNIGDDYDKLKDYPDAIKGFTQSVLVKPNYADAYHNRANIFFKTGNLDLARESYQIALKFSPTLYQTYLSLTQIDLMQKNGDLALADATKAVELQPTDLQSNYVLGIVKAQIGQLDEAKKIFQGILSVYPTYTPASEALSQLEALTKPSQSK